MRKLIAAVCAAGVVALFPVPASALGDVRMALILGGNPQVACDTSAYPVAPYRCSFEFDSTDCREYSTRGLNTSCVVGIRGTLVAIPAAVPTGRCSFSAANPFSVTLTSGIDPSWQTAAPAVGVVAVQSAEAAYGQFGVVTSAVLSLTVAGLSPTVLAGEIEAGFAFPDLMWDCRTRAGGDPASAPSGLTPGVEGVLVGER